MTRPPLRLGIPLVALGGALGAVARWALSDAFPASAGQFPWAVFAINVSGCALLALLPALPVVRRSHGLPLLLGTGVLGGFTTLSTAAVQTVQLDGHSGIALAYLFGTLFAALLAVAAIDLLSDPPARRAVEADEGDE